MVIWLIGISGAGKSTLANELKKHYDELGIKNYIIDGDDVRHFFDNDLGYSREAREMNIKRIILAAHVLDQNDIVTIVANIAPFEHLRSFARTKIKGYVEIFLRKDLQISMQNDVKKVYEKNAETGDIIGVNIGFDEPLNSDLTLDIDRLTVQEATDTILDFISKKAR